MTRINGMAGGTALDPILSILFILSKSRLFPRRG
jgi:hypothetical protein